METQFADSEIRSEMIKALRGDDSQFDLSRELGFSFNQVHKWESGAKRFLWPEFVALCQLKKIPILEILRKVFSFLGDDPADAQELMFCLKQFFAHLSIDGLAKEVEVHPSMLRRWLAGSVVPDLDIVLKLLSLRPGLLQSFLANVFPDRQLPILHESLDRYKNQKLMEAQLPIAPAIEAVLSTEDYRKLVDHSDNWVAEKVGTTADVINSAMAVMLKAGTIKQEDRKFVVTYNRIDMHGLDQKDLLRLACYWTLKAANRFAVERVPEPSNDPHRVANLLGYRIVPMSKESAKKVTGKLVECLEEILRIVEADEGPMTEARVVLMHHFAVADRPLPSDLSLIGRDLTQLIASFEKL